MPGTDPFPSYRPDGPGRGEAYDSEHWVGTSNDWISFFLMLIKAQLSVFLLKLAIIYDAMKCIPVIVKLNYSIIPVLSIT